MEGPVLNQPYKKLYSDNQGTIHNAASDRLHHFHRVSDHFFILLISACQQLQTHSPIKKVLNKIRDSCQTYFNYYKTHAMATHYGRIGDTSVSNSEQHDMVTDDYQANINDLENSIYNSGKTTIISAIKLLQSNPSFDGQPQTQICCRRSLLPFLGDALSWLTGTATTRDINSIKTWINQLITTQS